MTPEVLSRPAEREQREDGLGGRPEQAFALSQILQRTRLWATVPRHCSRTVVALALQKHRRFQPLGGSTSFGTGSTATIFSRLLKLQRRVA